MASVPRLFRAGFWRICNVNLVFRKSPHRKLCSSQDVAKLSFRNGYPVLSVPLPSRQEHCEFTLLPLSHSVKDFLNNLQKEDGGVERAAVYSLDGSRISRSTGIDILLQSDFRIVINDQSYTVHVPEEGKLSLDDSRSLSHIKSLVHQLYTSMNVEQHQFLTRYIIQLRELGISQLTMMPTGLGKERKLLQQLEKVKLELGPMEDLKTELDKKASQRANFMVWGGLGYMALQFGILARLTWWEYSWDIMEPVTYFVGTGTAMVAYAYFVLTRQEFLYPDARDRQYLISFHKLSKRKLFDVSKYNELKSKVNKIQDDLKVLQSPLHLHLPQKPIQKEQIEE